MVLEEKMIMNGEPDDEEEEEEEEEEDMVVCVLEMHISIFWRYCPFTNCRLMKCGPNLSARFSTAFLFKCASILGQESQDPLESVRQKCEEAEHCLHARARMEECETRVGSRSSTEEDCTEELFDFLHARDHCVAHKLFHSVK